jgi:GT2 family glycosyltransferase
MLSVIIVNYHSANLIIEALDSFLPDSNLAPEIIVVDNDSGEDEINLIVSKYPGVKILQMGYNAGFARANNAGIKEAKGETVLLLNPDTLAPGKAIDLCYQEFSASSYIACGVQLLNTDGSPQISGNYFMTGGLNHLLPLPIVGDLLKWIGQVAGVKKTNLPDSNSLQEVDWINGAFLMVKQSAIAKAGLLDEDFFLYAEEIEWCARLGRIGKLCVFGQYKVTHLQGETANQKFGSSGKGYYNLYDRKGLQILVSNFLRIRKQFGLFWFSVHLLVYLFEIPVLAILSLVSAIFRTGKFPLLLFSGYVKNMGALLKLAPRMAGNRPYFYKMI